MADNDPTNAGDQVTNTPTNIGLPPDAQFRTLSKRLDALAEEVRNIPRPNSFRLADGISLAVIVIGLLIALYTASGLGARIDDIKASQASSENRTDGEITSAEARITTRLDKLNDQFISLDERSAKMEGGQKRHE